MARKLSEITRWARRTTPFLIALFATNFAAAEDRNSTTSSSITVQNPYATGETSTMAIATDMEPENPRGLAHSAESSEQHVPAPLTAINSHATREYRNPFAPGAVLPPISFPLHAGPLSRWQRSAPPFLEPMPIKSAILTVDALSEVHIPWDQPRPTQESPSILEEDSPADTEFADPPHPAEFTAAQLDQPTWVAAKSAPPQLIDPVNQAAFQEPLASPARLIAGNANTPEDWLAEAERRAQSAHSLDDFAAVAHLCVQGLAGEPNEKLSKPLRELAAWAHNRRGEQLADAGRAGEAIDAFQTAISLDDHCSLAIHNRAVTHAQRGQFDAALVDFNRVIELNPGLAVAYRNRAELLAAMDRMEEATADYSRAIEPHSSDAELYSARGHAWQQMGEFDRAIDDFNRAIEIDPNSPQPFTLRGNLAAERGDYQRALADFRQAIAVEADHAEAHRSLAWLHATCPIERFRDEQQALASARRAVELSPPGNHAALEALAAAQAAAGQLADAVATQQQALATAPPEARETLNQRLALYQSQQSKSAARSTTTR